MPLPTYSFSLLGAVSSEDDLGWVFEVGTELEGGRAVCTFLEVEAWRLEMSQIAARVENPLQPSLSSDFSGLLDAILTSAPGRLAHIDADLYFVHVNHAYARALDKTPEDLIGQRYSAFFAATDELELFERARRTGKPVDFRRTGSGARGRVAPVLAADGQVVGFVISLSEARFRTIFEDAAVGIALIDRENHVVASNPALQRMLGYTGGELRGRRFADFTHPEDLSASDELYQELLEGKREHYHVEKRYLRKDGSILWVRPTVSVIHSGLSPLYAVKMVEDITEQKKAQEALIKAEKLSLVGRLGATMAHEINNPLQTVIGCLGLAEESLADGRDPSRYLKVAREDVHRAARIVTQLRNLHRRTDEEDREPADLNALLSSASTLMRKEADNRRVEMVLDLDDDVPPLTLMADKVRQAFLNVTLNAIESMLDGGRLTLRTERTHAPDGVRVSIIDQGEGISEQNMANLFDPFYSTKPDGLGLGLYVSRHIVLDHRGEMAIDSHPGHGTTVTIWLPIIH